MRATPYGTMNADAIYAQQLAEARAMTHFAASGAAERIDTTRLDPTPTTNAANTANTSTASIVAVNRSNALAWMLAAGALALLLVAFTASVNAGGQTHARPGSGRRRTTAR
ncbi:MAG: hypothetical protein H7287_00795 [Thermoleophilia bacterium]|nr:hypothetical protein [Thermoleophilia bacterium]